MLKKLSIPSHVRCIRSDWIILVQERKILSKGCNLFCQGWERTGCWIMLAKEMGFVEINNFLSLSIIVFF